MKILNSISHLPSSKFLLLTSIFYILNSIFYLPYSAPTAHAAFRISRPPYLLGLTAGLVGHWTFDGNKMLTNVADSSGQGNNGSLVGQAATTTVPGKVGQALQFDGTDDY